MSFESATARDLNVLIHKESGFINYTKLCKGLSGGIRQAFKELVRKNPGFQKLVLSMEESTGATAPTEITMEKLIEFKVLFCVKGGSNQEARGTYGPRYMLDYLIFHFKPEYYKLIHRALENIEKLAQVKEVSFHSQMEKEIEYKEYEIKRLTSENGDLLKKNDELINEVKNLRQELQESRSEIDFLVNKAITSEYALDELRENDRQIIDKILDVNREVGNIPVKLKRMGKVHNILSIYTSATKPVNPVARNRAHEGEIWLGTYVGQEINKRRSVPADFEEIYSSDFNGLDSFTDVLQNETLSPFILKTHQRSILVSEEHLEEFIDTLNAYLNQTGNYNSVVNLGETLRRIQNRNRKAAFVEKKREILAQFPNLHIRINNWNRKVYTRIDGELVAPTAETAELSWFYRYGKDGAYKAEINEKMIENFAFANKGDSRIKYE